MRAQPRAVVVAAAGVVALLVLVTVARSCSGPDGVAVPTRVYDTTIEVHAASSLRHAFADIAGQFEQEHEVGVDLVLGASGSLADALTAQDSPDVFAGADTFSLAQAGLADDGTPLFAAEPLVFAANRLVLAVPRGNPDDIADLGDVEGDVVAMCDPNSSCGRLGQHVLVSTGLGVRPVVGADAAATTRLVIDGDAGAGLIFATDAEAAGDDLDLVELPSPQNRVSFSAISALEHAPEPEAAQEFVDFVLGEVGQATLEKHGFASGRNPHLQPED